MNITTCNRAVLKVTQEVDGSSKMAANYVDEKTEELPGDLQARLAQTQRLPQLRCL